MIRDTGDDRRASGETTSGGPGPSQSVVDLTEPPSASGERNGTVDEIEEMDAPTVVEWLERRRGEIDALRARFDDSPDAIRGAVVKMLITRLSSLQAVRAEIWRPYLKDVDDAGGLSRFDQLSHRVGVLLSRLDTFAAGVGPRDVMFQRDRQISSLVEELTEAVGEYDHLEVGLSERLEAGTPEDQLKEMAKTAERVATHSQTHPHPDRPPADEQAGLRKRAGALYDRLRDVTSHPKAVLAGGGEEGP